MEVSDDVFVPASHVKRLRREALEMLETEVLSRYRKNRYNYKNRMENVELKEAADDNENTETGIKQIVSGKRTYKLGVTTKEQLLVLLDAAAEGRTDVAAVYVGISLYRQIITSDKLMDKLKKSGLKIYIETSYVAKDNFDIDALNIDFEYVKGIYVRNIGGYAAVKKSKLYEMVETGKLELVIGSGLYAYNREAVGFIGNWLYENPQELNLKELEQIYSLPNYRGELLIYGYQPAMISAQCIKGNFYGCSKDKKDTPAAKKITDDRGNVFYSKPYCDECINVVYNGVLYNIIDKLDEIEERISPVSYRLNFTLEDPKTVEEILKGCPQDREYTAGHMYRGVE
jgi:putative protease